MNKIDGLERVAMELPIELEVDSCKVVNFAMQQNHVPVIHQIRLRNTQTMDYTGLRVEINAEPEYCHPWRKEVSQLHAGETLSLDCVDLRLAATYLLNLTERIAGNLVIAVYQGEEKLTQMVCPVDILAYDEWSGLRYMPEMVAAFSSPNHPAVTALIRTAGGLLQTWTGSAAFTGYQSDNPNTVRKQIAAIYGAVQKAAIRYCMPPASFEAVGQKIRIADQVLEQKLGTCLDMALLFVSCLEFVGLHPLLIFQHGHAFPGCWLEEHCFPECVQEDASLLTKRIAVGINEICVWESTQCMEGKSIEFADSCTAAAANLSDFSRFEFFVDVKRTRFSGIRPIPVRVRDSAGMYCLAEEQPEVKTVVTAAPMDLQLGQKLQDVDKIAVSKQQIWERKLLDLSLRNPLINFRVTKNTLQLLCNSLAMLEDVLSDGKEFQILCRPQELSGDLRNDEMFALANHTSITDTLLSHEFSNQRLRTFLSEAEVTRAMTGIYRAAKVSLEENGANTLYLALGFLRWFESDVSERERFAPLVLYPIDIVRRGAQKGYVIRVRDEEPQINVTLLEMLRADFGIQIGGLDPLPADESGINLQLIFQTIRQAVMQKSRWEVVEVSFIGLFSFSQFIMWNDIRNRSEDLQQNKVVASLISGRLAWEPTAEFPSPATLDDTFSPLELAVPLSADSSQLAAISAAGAGESFVLHGPPGTGKSQTITNMIANALYQGKSVLFIAEKMAALSVVQKRLAAIGLDPFCLELHSNKAKKKDVLAQLDRTLQMGQLKSPAAFQAEGERLYELRKELNEVITCLHKRYPCGLSLYDAIATYEENVACTQSVTFAAEWIATLTEADYRNGAELCDELTVSANSCGTVQTHPLRAMRRLQYSPTMKNTLQTQLQQADTTLHAMLGSAAQFGTLLGISIPSVTALEQTCALLETALSQEYLPSALVACAELIPLGERLRALCECGQARDAARTALLVNFTEQVLTFDAATAQRDWMTADAKWFLPKLLGQGKVKKSLAAFSRSEVSTDSVLPTLQQLATYQGKQQTIAAEATCFAPLFGLLWRDGACDWTKLQVLYTAAVQLRQRIGQLSQPDTRAALLQVVSQQLCADLQQFRQQYGEAVADCRAQLSQFAALQNAMSEETGTDDAFWVAPLDTIRSRFAEWAANLDLLRDWGSYRAVCGRMEQAGLSGMIEAVERGTLAPTEVKQCYFRNVSQAAALYIVSQEPALSSFQGALFENLIEKYGACCDTFSNYTKQELAARLSAKIPSLSQGVADSSEIGILQKAIRNGGRMLSIRKLFDKMPNLLRRLCPCMLMSPISVAQYIDPSYPKFDLVIFDEASQMSTCEAVGAIARGENLIVVGDPNQLPPTSFFSTNRVDEENFEQEDMESILDDCLALSMPQEHLLWHYRSRHESLIAFSNRRYYGNQLYTFPSPDDLVSEVRHIPVSGYYDRGKTKQNRAEAEAVVAEIVRRLRDPILCKKSIGVVTFSVVQQNLIDDMLMEQFSREPALEETANAMYEPLFIKNLENVQGDERDVIMFSVGYGADENGKVALNFGPLNRDGGWRRLNVAVSRSREQMLVYSVLRPDQIELSKTRADGVAGLKAFLEFAMHGTSALPAATEETIQPTDRFAQCVAQRIAARGYQVRTQVGCSAYQIDIGIVHPENPNRFVLGILCDGVSYRNAGTARDRNLLQVNMLRALHWNVHRLWAMDWWENAEKELDRIEAAIAAACEAPLPAQQVPVTQEPVLFERAVQVEAPALPQYHVCTLEAVSQPADAFYAETSNRLMLGQIQKVLETEAPISRRQLVKRLLAAWGIARTGQKIEKRLDLLLQLAQVQLTVAEETQFVWLASQNPESYDQIRVPEDEESKRTLEDISPEEYAAAARWSLQQLISLPVADLTRELYRRFGYARAGTQAETAVLRGIALAQSRGWIAQAEGRYLIPEEATKPNHT